MKTVISSTGDSRDALFDLRFGRATFFCIYDNETKEVKFFKNEYANATGGAGTKTASLMAELDIQKVISGDFGPKAKELLNKLKIQMVIISDEKNTIDDILKKIEA